MTAQHTPGQWVVHDAFPYQRIVSEEGNRVIVASMGGDSVEDDAHLIAAAPELLTALQETVQVIRLLQSKINDSIEGKPLYPIIVPQVEENWRPIIAKALGQIEGAL